MKIHLERAVYKRLKKERTNIDRLALGVGIFAPLNAIPQLLIIWQGDATGVSLIMWSGFLVVGLILLAYSIVHWLVPLIISNVLWIVVDVAVIIGVISNRS